MEILKLTAKKAPIPTLAVFLIYLIFTRIIEDKPSELIIIVICVMTFIISLSLLLFYEKNKADDIGSISDNKISAETDTGDVFIGSKASTDKAFDNISNNVIKKTKVNNGDVFIGKKK